MEFGIKRKVADIADGIIAQNKVLSQFGQVDIFINCAGITAPTGDCLEISAAAWPETLGVER